MSATVFSANANVSRHARQAPLTGTVQREVSDRQRGFLKEQVPLLVTIHAEKFMCDRGCGLSGCYTFVAVHELDCKGMQYPSTF
jgi:hypothetical protein